MKKILLITVVMLALLLAACNGADSKADNGATTVPGTQPTQGAQDNAGNDEPIGTPNVEDSIFDDPDTATVPAESVTNSGTEPAETEPEETKPTEPEVTEPQGSEPEDPDTPDEPDHIIDSGDEPGRPEGPDLSMTYDQFQSLSPTEMRLFEESFESKDAFFEWYNAAKEAYNAAHPPIDVGDGSITLPND